MVAGIQGEIRYRSEMLTGAREDIRNGHDVVTAVQGEIRYHPHMVSAVQEEIPYCSPGTSSGKQKKARSTSQSQFRRESTHATVEAEQILLALQQLATNSNSANFNNNINRISKLTKPLTTTCPHLM